MSSDRLRELIAKWRREAVTIKETLGHHSDPKDDTIASMSWSVRVLLADELEAALTDQPDATAPAIPRPDCELLSSPESLLAFDDELNPEPDEPTRELPPVAPPAQVSEEQVRNLLDRDTRWQHYEADLKAAKGRIHESHFSASSPVWFERGWNAAVNALLRSPASTSGKETL